MEHRPRVHVQIQNGPLASTVERVLEAAGYPVERVDDETEIAPGSILLTTERDTHPDSCARLARRAVLAVVFLISTSAIVQSAYVDAGASILEIGAPAGSVLGLIEGAWASLSRRAER